MSDLRIVDGEREARPNRFPSPFGIALQNEALNELPRVVLASGSMGALTAAVDLGLAAFQKSAVTKSVVQVESLLEPLLIEKIQGNAALQAESAAARKVMDSATANVRTNAASPDRVIGDLRQTYMRMKSAGVGDAAMNNVARQLEVVERMKANPRLAGKLLETAVGTEDQLRRGVKAFSASSSNYQVLKEYAQGIAQQEKAVMNFGQAQHAFDTSNGALRSELLAANKALQKAEHSAATALGETVSMRATAMRGFGRGAGAAGVTLAGLYGAESLASRFDEQSALRFKVAPLMEPNVADVGGIAVLATKNFPGRLKAAGYAASLVAGRVVNAVSEIMDDRKK